MSISMTVKAEIDTTNVESQLSKIKQDSSVQQKIKDQQERLQELEGTVFRLQKQLATVDAPKAAPLRKERNVVFKEIDDLQEKKIAILSKIESKTKDATTYIELGMTPDEVRSLIGSPRAIDSCAGEPRWNYGQVWVVFDSGVVSCIVKNTCFQNCASRGLYEAIRCIVK